MIFFFNSISRLGKEFLMICAVESRSYQKNVSTTEFNGKMMNENPDEGSVDGS